MCDLVHFDHGNVDLADARALFPRGPGDFGGEILHFLRADDNFMQGDGHLLADLNALGGMAGGTFHFGGGFPGGGGTALSEVADLLGHDPKTHARLAGTRGLDGRIQRQEIGLKGNLMDQVVDLADVGAGRVDLIDAGLQRFHLMHAVLGAA